MNGVKGVELPRKAGGPCRSLSRCTRPGCPRRGGSGRDPARGRGRSTRPNARPAAPAHRRPHLVAVVLGNPSVRLQHGSNCAGFEVLAEHADASPACPWLPICVMTLYWRAPRPRQGLVDAVRQRLLAVDVLVQLDRHHGGAGVTVVRDGDEHRVDLLVQLVEHLAVVVIGLDLWPYARVILVEPIQGVRHPPVVNVDRRDQVLTGGDGHVSHPLAVGANHGRVQFGVRRTARPRRPANPQPRRRPPRQQRRQTSSETLTSEAAGHGSSPWGCW